MINRSQISVPYNQWNDAQRVDKADMDTEQSRNVQIDASIINNHFGSGVLPDSIQQKVLFDSDDLTQEQAALVVSNDFDGTGLDSAEQPTDTNLGEQLEVELTGANVSGRFSTKVLIIGLDFQGVPQYDRFEFYKNEKQVTKKHYSRILTIFFNDFKGNNNCSADRGGRVVIREAKSYQLSRDSVMAAQDFEPNLFFRDFKISGLISGSNPTTSLYLTLQDGMGPEYSVDSLNIQTTVKQNRTIEATDVVTKIGQKFKAKTNNIQKIQLLLGVERDDDVSEANRYDWTGDLVISLYELQTSVSCPTSIIPELAIEFDPNPVPLAQLSIDQADLKDIGYVLTDVLQPVDFVFSDTKLGSTSNAVIDPDKYYVVTMSRSGAANTGNIFTGVGNSVIDDSRLTLFNSSWVDVPEEQLWFRVFTNAAKISDGQAYDQGNGIEIPKTIINDLGATVDYALEQQIFADSGENVLNTGIVQATTEAFQEEQDERTGNPVNSRQKFIPSFSFLTTSNLNTLKETQNPLVIGAAQDTNPKRNPTLNKVQEFPGLVRGNTFRIINPDPDLLSNNLVGSKLVPNSLAAWDYKITKVTYCRDGYGDITGTGTIDTADIVRASELVGESIYLSSTQTKIANGEIDTLELIRADVDADGYVTSNDVTLITNYVTRQINSFPAGTYFTHLELEVQQSTGRFDGYHSCGDGYSVRIDGTSNNVVSGSSLSSTEQEYYGFVVTPNMNGTDPVFDTVPFSSVSYQIRPLPWYQDYLLAFSSDARMVPAAFTFDTDIELESCALASENICTDRSDVMPAVEPGRNDIMIPDNLIMRRGQFLNTDGTHYKVDFEVNHIILQLPEIPLQEATIDVFRSFVCDSGDGQTTNAAYPCLRFSDCSPVQSDALARNQVKFGVAVQAFNPNLDGYSLEDGYGVIVDDIIGVYMDHTNGLLTLSIQDLSVDPVYLSLVSKIEITVYLKKAGWNNNTLVIDSDAIQGLLI